MSESVPNNIYFTIYQYYDYMLYTTKDGKPYETFIKNSSLHMGIKKGKTTDVSKLIEEIKPRIRENTIADVVNVVVMEMSVDMEYYMSMMELYEEESIPMENFAEDMFGKIATSRGIYVLDTVPVVFRDRISIGKVKS